MGNKKNNKYLTNFLLKKQEIKKIILCSSERMIVVN